MAPQADGNLANQPGAQFRADLNNQLLALFTQHSGNGAPVTTYAFQPWVDTSASPPIWKVRNSTNTAWITVGTLDATFSIGGVTAIANGGTGQTTASGAINALVPSQTSNSGKALITNGTAVSWGSAGAPSKIEIFASSTTWTCPDGVTFVTATVIGGGGGGASTGGSSPTFSGGNGGDGGVGCGCIAVTPGTVYTVTVGAGGTGANSGSASAGGTSTFSTITATGGGAGGTLANQVGPNGSNGTCTSGDANLFQGNINTVQTIPYIWRNIQVRAGGANRTAAVEWSVTLGIDPGANGVGETSSTQNDASGGVGGIVMLQY